MSRSNLNKIPFSYKMNHRLKAETVDVHVSLHLFIIYLHIMGRINVGS